jgi:hypothetical protein
MGKGTAYSHYLKIMSYYKLKDYENCKQQAAAYLKSAEIISSKLLGKRQP